jgi:hypothetical protein
LNRKGYIQIAAPVQWLVLPPPDVARRATRIKSVPDFARSLPAKSFFEVLRKFHFELLRSSASVGIAFIPVLRYACIRLMEQMSGKKDLMSVFGHIENDFMFERNLKILH